MKFDRDEEEEKEGKSEYKKKEGKQFEFIGAAKCIYRKKRTIGGGEKMGMVDKESKKKKKSKGKI